MKKNKGLFISHADQYSGAPKALFNILKFILNTYPINIDIQVNESIDQGVFENLKHSNKIINIFYKKQSKYRVNRIIKNRLFFLIKKIYLKNKIKNYNKKYDFIFFNSITFHQIEFDLNEIMVPKYLYLHEGNMGLFSVLRNNYSVFKSFDYIFVPSNIVLNDLVNHGIEPSKIAVLQLFLDKDEICSAPPVPLFLKNKPLVVGNLANIDWRKGSDYFLATAKLYKELYPNDYVNFKWKGYLKDSFYYSLLNYEIEKAGLESFVFLEEKGKDTKDFFSSIDVFLLTSKEETFGFVVLEAANHSKPAITFKKSIGASVFIDCYGGFTADYLAINQFVDFLKKYYDDRDLMKSHGNNAKRLLNENYILDDKMKNELKEILDVIFC